MGESTYVAQLFASYLAMEIFLNEKMRARIIKKLKGGGRGDGGWLKFRARKTPLGRMTLPTEPRLFRRRGELLSHLYDDQVPFAFCLCLFWILTNFVSPLFFLSVRVFRECAVKSGRLFNVGRGVR